MSQQVSLWRHHDPVSAVVVEKGQIDSGLFFKGVADAHLVMIEYFGVQILPSVLPWKKEIVLDLREDAGIIDATCIGGMEFRSHVSKDDAELRAELIFKLIVVDVSKPRSRDHIEALLKTDPVADRYIG